KPGRPRSRDRGSACARGGSTRGKRNRGAVVGNFRSRLGLYNFLADQFRIGTANGKALSVLHFYHHTTIEMLLDLFQKIQVDDRAAVNANKNFRIEDFLQLTNT